MFKSRRYEGIKHSQMMLESPARNIIWDRTKWLAASWSSANKFGEVEDPFVWKTAEGYEMIAKDMTGKLVGEKHAGVHARSKDGLRWSWRNARRPGRASSAGMTE